MFTGLLSFDGSLGRVACVTQVSNCEVSGNIKSASLNNQPCQSIPMLTTINSN